MPPKGKGTSRIARLEQRLASLQTDINGRVLANRSVDPPRVNLRPYYPLVLSLDAPTAGDELVLFASDLVSGVAKQLGLATETRQRMNVRVQQVRMWGFQYGTASDRVSVNMDVSSLVPTVQDIAAEPLVAVNYPIIAKLKDFGSSAKPAFVGYEWPKSHQLVPLHSNSNFQVVAAASNANNATLLVHVLWSTTDVAPPAP